MKQLKTSSLMATLACCLATVIHANDSGAPYIANYQDNKQAALSFTFDDGFRAEVNDALEIIEPLDIRGTFFIIPHYMEGSERRDSMINWEEAIALHAKGQELGTHGTTKNKLHEIDDGVLDFEVNGGWQLIKERIGVTTVAYAAPGGSSIDERVEAKVSEHHFAIRNKNILPASVIMSYGSVGKRVWDDVATRVQIEAAIKNGEWFVPLVHAIVAGYSPFKSKEEFRSHCEWIASKREVLWVAPLGEVGAYVFQKEASALEIIESKPNGIKLKLAQTEPTPFEYGSELTVVIPVSGASEAEAESNTQGELEVVIEKDLIRFNALPDGEAITVYWN
jgi:peptidoglycan/xylan/chitin deacetylase (PgdA/CDA1 family)